MNEREALLRAVCDNPDDDTPRLVFADWLQEHGDEARAEFIRVQIELTRGATGKREAKLKRRERTLLSEFGHHWLARVREYTSPGWGDEWWEFRRGFVEQMSIHDNKEEEFFAASRELFAEMPLTRLWFPYLQDYQAISEWEGLESITELLLQGSVLAHHTGIGSLFQSRHAKKLQTLHLNGYDDNGHADLGTIRELAESHSLASLKHLDLYCNWSSGWPDGQEWARILSKSPLLAQLDHLAVGGTDLTGEGVEHFTRSERLAKLRHLDLSANPIGERGFQALVDAPHLGTLAILDLRDLQESDEDDPVRPTTRAKLIARFGDRVRLDSGV